MKECRTIREIVNQLMACDYECEGGFLKDNIAFVRLCEIAELNYQPKFQINEEVYYNGDIYYIRSINAKANSYPYPEVEYDLSKEQNRSCTTNKSDLCQIGENALLTKNEYRLNKIEEAMAFLKTEGIL